ncbi:putative F-box/kelch-repeat protein At3g17280 isoform X3 [Lolium rigidum]|uniref:putative F-box/kelch-repeat protein At3g17280 isoform X3 n=1 Tax=Lolium rigidum TaxID=89674 RepID=UPI001F5E3508|nr:putative F-box/kelch-repeat protein At3g17280 isoform X3 [Lolium rigidum]
MCLQRDLVAQLPWHWVVTMVTGETSSKRQINEECIINCLPVDLIERIFFRLPVSTLLRCAGVCKHWYNFIRDPLFVASHLQNAHRYALMFFPQGLVSGEPHPSDAILIDEAWSLSTYAVPVIGPDDLLFGSCNGLLGLYTKTSTIKIANFATGECMHLAKPGKNMRGDHFTFYSFGFHPVTKEYKITHFLGDCVEGRPRNKDKFSIIQVYTLGDEKWKDIPTPEALSLNTVRNSGVVNVNGTMYSLTENMIASWQHAVMSFDLREESFAIIALPAAREDHDHYGPRKFWIRDSYELIGENIEISFSKMEELLDVSPRKLYNMQSYICVKSLVCLDVYKKASIVRRPKQQVGWQLKKWEAWEHNLRELEKLWGHSQKQEHHLSEIAEKIVKKYQPFTDKFHAISENLLTIRNQVLQHKPENLNQPRFPRRLNLVAQERDREELSSRVSKISDSIEAISQAQDNISSILRSHMLDQGKSTANVSSSDDKKNE